MVSTDNPGELEKLEHRVDMIDKDIQIINAKLNAIENNITTTIQSSIKTASDVQFTKMREYIASAISEEFQEQDYRRLKEKEETKNDYKKHSVKTIIQYITTGILGGGMAIILYFTSLDSTEKNIQINAYYEEVQMLREELKRLGGEKSE